MGRRKNRKHGASWKHPKRNSIKKNPQSEDKENGGTKAAADVPANREGMHESQEDSFFADSESSLGDSFDSSGADFVMVDHPETGSITPTEGDLSLVNEREAFFSSYAECNESMRIDDFSETKETVNAGKLPMTADSEEKKILLDSLCHIDGSIVIVESTSNELACSTKGNLALCIPSSEGKEVTLNQSEVEPQFFLQNPELEVEVCENDLSENITSVSIEDNVPQLKCEHLINRNADSEECVRKDEVENSRIEMRQEFSDESKTQDLGTSSSVAVTQFSETSEETECPQYISLHVSNDNLLQDVVGSKTPLVKDLKSPESNTDCITKISKSGEVFQDGKNIQHHLTNEHISLNSAPSSSTLVQYTLIPGDQCTPQNATKIPKAVMNQNEDQGEILNTNTSNEDTNEYSQSRKNIISQDEAKEDSLKSEDNSLEDLMAFERDLKQNGITDTNEDQSSQKYPGTTYLTSAQSISKEASEKSALGSSLLSNDNHLKKESEKQSCEQAKHQVPEEVIINQTCEKKDALKPRDSTDIQSFQEVDSLKDLSENAIGQNEPMEETPETLPCDKAAKGSPAKTKCDSVKLVPGDDQASRDVKEESSSSGESTKNDVCLHQNEILGTSGDQPPSSGTLEDQEIGADESVGQRPVKLKENEAEAVHVPQQEPPEEIQLDEVDKLDRKQTNNTNPNSSSNDESLDSINEENAAVSPNQTFQLTDRFLQDYNSWSENTKAIMAWLKCMQHCVTHLEQCIVESKSYCIQLSLQNRLKQERASWFGRITGAMGSIISNNALSVFSLVHVLIITVARVQLLRWTKSNLSFKKRMYTNIPFPIVEDNSVEDCFKEVSKTTICGAVSDCLDKINARKAQKVNETKRSNLSSFIYGLFAIIKNHFGNNAENKTVKALQDFLIENQCIVEAYLAASKTVYSSCDFLKTFFWNTIIRKRPDVQSNMTDFALLMHEYSHQNLLHEQLNGKRIPSSVIPQIKNVTAAIQAEADKINTMVQKMRIAPK